jgi:flagellar hook-associated protein 2
MGTVGLSFGSPTSGAGFDVSATVAQIVGNLQNVETPWKTQLTKLESQDTAISSLGSLMSSLSNDMSALTDFQGVMALKLGQSSDTNVLELTAATSSATSGTHTVVVNSVAQTSSGYLAEVTNFSATLSGSITLQAGGGTTETFVIGTQPDSGAAGNTVYTGSGADTLSDLASAINSSGVGVTANVESDSTGSWLSLTSGISGAGGNITVSSNSIAAGGQVLGYSGAAGTDASGSNGTTTSSGTLAGVGSSDDLSGTISIQVGNGAPLSVTMDEVKDATGGSTIGDLVTYLQDNDSSVVDAEAVTNSDGTVSLSLTSQTAGSAGTLAVNSSLIDTGPNTLGYTSGVTGSDAILTIDGKSNIHNSSNTVSNLIPGLTFQLLAASSNPIQVVIGNDNSGVESTMNQMVNDYNSLISAMNTQEGNDISGNPEPLFGSPTLSLLQQELLSSLNMENPDGYVDSVSSAAGATVSGSINLSLAGGIPLYYSGTAGVDATDGAAAQTSAGTLAPITNAGDTLSGSITITVGSGKAQTITLDSSDNTLAGLEQAINNTAGIGVTASVVTNADGSSSLSLVSGTSGFAGTLTVDSSIADTSVQTIQVPTTSGNNTLSGLADAINASHSGVTAAVVTNNGESTLTLISQTEGVNGALKVSSALTASTPTALGYSDGGSTTSTTEDTGMFGTVLAADDILSGSLTIQVGNGDPQTITLDSSDNTLSGLMSAINGLTGVSAALNSTGTALVLTSGTDGTDGALAVTSNIYDTSNRITSTLSYNTSSDITNLTSLGISVNNDGSLAFDANALDSVLNTDFSSVVGFFQNLDSWGMTFSNMLDNAGSGSSTGILSLAQKANSGTESTLNADISKEEGLISAQQTSLTAELDSANEVMQMLPSQLQGINELYSAITGYNQGTNG